MSLDSTLEALRAAIAGLEPRRSRWSLAGRVSAGVCVPLQLGSPGLEVLMIKRPGTMRQHAREVAFPGGRAEPGDLDLLDTALRETWEELGLKRQDLEPLGAPGTLADGWQIVVTGVTPDAWSGIQDAVAAANILWRPLSQGWVSLSHLQKVQWRRELPTRMTQWAQIQVQKRVLGRVLGNTQQLAALSLLRLFKKFPVLRRIPARLIGIGVRPEHVRTPDILSLECRL